MRTLLLLTAASILIGSQPVAIGADSDSTASSASRGLSAASGYGMDSPLQTRRDNSGRQLAIAIPHPPTTHINVNGGAALRAQPPLQGTIGKIDSAVISQNVYKSALAAANKMEVQARPIIQTAMIGILQFCRWTGALFKQFNELPVITPAGPPYAYTKPMVMQARSMLYTTEGRIKTIVHR